MTTSRIACAVIAGALGLAVPGTASAAEAKKPPVAKKGPADGPAAPAAPLPPPPAPEPVPVPAEALEKKPAPAAETAGRPESVEIQLRLLADKLVAGLRDEPGQGRYARWAVMPFSEQGDEVSKRKLGQVVPAALETDLKADHGFFCVERMRLSQVLKEIQLSQTGLLEESKAPEIGKMANADIIVTGSVGMLGPRYVVNAKAVSVEAAKVLAAAQVTIDAAGLVALSSEAVVLRTRSDAVLRSALIPGWGQLYNRQESKGGLLMFSAVALAGGGVLFQLLGSSAESSYASISRDNQGECTGRTPDQLVACVASVRERAESRYGMARTLFLGLGAVYAYNLLDAFLFGYKPDASTKSLYSGPVFQVAPDGVAVSATF